MENAGSAIVDFGRFMTGFLVLMGIGMWELPFEWQKQKPFLLSKAKETVRFGSKSYIDLRSHSTSCRACP
jgi:hypothetical protein